jgi:lysophospholipase L1-like esterase
MGENTVLALFIGAPMLMGLPLFALARRNKKISARKKRPTSWPSLVLGNGAVLLFLLSLGLLAGEVYFRFFFDTTDAVNVSRVSRRWFARYWNTNGNKNQFGCRDNVEYGKLVPEGKRRVSFLGDSFTAGQGIKNIQDRFVNRIRAKRSDWEIHMVADLGWDTDTELGFLKEIAGDGYQLDNVVLVFCLNDVSDLIPNWMDSLKGALADIRDAGFLVQNSYLVNFLYTHWKVMHNPYTRDYYSFIGDGYRGAIWEQEMKQLRELRDLVNAKGGKLMVVTFPFVNAVGANYPYAGIHKQLEEFWNAEKVPHLDLLSIYKNERSSKLTVNRFDAHPSEYAHQLATDAIEKFVTLNLAPLQTATNR